MGEYNAYDMSQQANANANAKDTENAIKISKKENAILKPKVRKLTKKLLLVDATEAVDVVPIPAVPIPAVPEPIAEAKVKKTRQKKILDPVKKLLIIDEDD
jgi:hypothetical protein